MTPAMRADSASVRFVTSFPKKIRAASAHAVDGKRSAIAEVDVVQVELEDLLFRRLCLEDDRHEHLERFAPIRAERPASRAALQFGVELVAEEKHARQLLRDRASSNRIPSIAAEGSSTRRRPG